MKYSFILRKERKFHASSVPTKHTNKIPWTLTFKVYIITSSTHVKCVENSIKVVFH